MLHLRTMHPDDDEEGDEPAVASQNRTDCDDCGFEAGNERRLRKHVRDEHAAPDTPKACDKCEFETMDRRTYREHVAEAHVEETTSAEENNSLYTNFRHSVYDPLDEKETEPVKIYLKKATKKADIEVTPTKTTEEPTTPTKSADATVTSPSIPRVLPNLDCDHCAFKARTPKGMATHVSHKHRRGTRKTSLKVSKEALEELRRMSGRQPSGKKARSKADLQTQCEDCGHWSATVVHMVVHRRAVHGRAVPLHGEEPVKNEPNNRR